MTDDEVKQWLSEDERERWPIGGTACCADWLRDGLRALAETRKALAVMLDNYEVERDFCGNCPLCQHVHVNHSMTTHRAHEPTCIFATMPRPK